MLYDSLSSKVKKHKKQIVLHMVFAEGKNM